MNRYHLQVFSAVEDFIDLLSKADQANVHGDMDSLADGNYARVHVKTLRRPIKELIVKQYRFVFFIHRHSIYFVSAFVKKTAKTPVNKIEHAEKIYKVIVNTI